VDDRRSSSPGTTAAFLILLAHEDRFARRSDGDPALPAYYVAETPVRDVAGRTRKVSTVTTPRPRSIASAGKERALPFYLVETSGLTKRFGGKTVVDHVDLRIPRGVAFGYLGPNGAGKTTLIRMLLGLTAPTAGQISLLGHSVPSEREAALARVGAMVEEPRFHDYLTGRENLGILAAAREPAAVTRTGPALARVGLADRADDRVGTYSQGMRQRLGVAACLLADPALLILDEPTNGLDPAGILEFRDLVRGLVAEGRTVVLSSHLLDEVEKICDAVAIVDHGRVVVQGSLSEVLSDRRGTLLIDCSDPSTARALLAHHPAVRAIETLAAGTLRLVLVDGDPQQTAAAITGALVAAGLGVYRVEPTHPSLEERFLEITSRLEVAA
jgi:ABC-2 type transport system ATP-binding protein